MRRIHIPADLPLQERPTLGRGSLVSGGSNFMQAELGRAPSPLKLSQSVRCRQIAKLSPQIWKKRFFQTSLMPSSFSRLGV